MQPRLGRTAFMVLALALAGCMGGKVVEGSGEAPAWSFTDTDGAMHSSNSSKGAPTLLFFMATWCTKCQSTAPRLADVHHQVTGDGVHFYTLSHDPTEDADDLKGWKATYNQMWPHGVDQGSKMAKTFGITRQSSIVILDADGVETKKWLYAVPSEAELRDALRAAG